MNGIYSFLQFFFLLILIQCAFDFVASRVNKEKDIEDFKKKYSPAASPPKPYGRTSGETTRTPPSYRPIVLSPNENLLTERNLKSGLDTEVVSNIKNHVEPVDHYKETSFSLNIYLNGESNPEKAISEVFERSKLCKSKEEMISIISKYAPGYYCNSNWYKIVRAEKRGASITKLVQSGTNSCRVFLNNAYEVSTCYQFRNNDNIWLVPPKREFIWPSFEPGHRVSVRHVSTSNDLPIVVESINGSPRLFHLHNFITETEAEQLIENALNIKGDTNGLHRSTTGQGSAAGKDSKRTSDNAWDMKSSTSILLKKRIFHLLGIQPYQDKWADGIQVLRYQHLQAYNSHYDYLDDSEMRLDTKREGGANRFATILLYLSDVEEGGETVFPNKYHPLLPKDQQLSMKDAISQARNIPGLMDNVTVGSWQERLIGECRSKLSVKPRKAFAALFYNQMPHGGQDDDSLHGGCPVLKGTKWAANLWVWNGRVHGDVEEFLDTDWDVNDPIEADFQSMVPGHSLWWNDNSFGEMEVGKSIRMNTFLGHKFQLRKGPGVNKATEELVYEYVVPAPPKNGPTKLTLIFPPDTDEEEEEEEEAEEEEDDDDDDGDDDDDEDYDEDEGYDDDVDYDPDDEDSEAIYGDDGSVWETGEDFQELDEL